MILTLKFSVITIAGIVFLLSGCQQDPPGEKQIVLTNGNVYSLSWSDPDRDGHPAEDAPFENGVWYPDAEAIYIAGNRILYVGTNEGAKAQAGSSAEIIDLAGATVVPGLVESHGHVHELGEHHEQLDLVDLKTKSDVVDLVAARAARVPDGEWIIGWGWDEGAWADDLPDWDELNERIPDHPVVLKGRRGFGAWANRLAFEAAGFAAGSADPEGGELVRDAAGALTGIALNNAVDALYDLIPVPSIQQRMRILSYGLDTLAASGYTTVFHAGVKSDYMPAYQALNDAAALKVRVHLMLAAVEDNQLLIDEYLKTGPSHDPKSLLQIREVKAYFDGSLGSRGASLLEDYSDSPGNRGVSGAAYGFNQAVVESLMVAGFQVGIHTIGDAANRAVLDFYEGVFDRHPGLRALRHRIEHAQVIHPEDFGRFGKLNIVASMEPAHAVEDSPWAEDRLGPERIRGAYAWRTLRRNGAMLIFNSDYSGTEFSPFYGLYAAITRTTRHGHPDGGWYPEQRVSPEEALRAYTVWPARASGVENMTGTLEAGKWADITVLSFDPLNVVLPGEKGIGIPAAELLRGQIVMTMVNGDIVYHNRQ